MLDYPAWFTALDRTRIEQARSEHGPPLSPDTGNNRFFVIFDVRYPSDADARAAVLAVLQVVADVLTPYHQHRAWADAARHLRDAVIVDIDRYRPYDTWPTLELFAGAIEQALADQTSWPVSPASQTGRARRSRETYGHRAAWLTDQLRAADHLTAYGLKKRFGGPDYKTIKKMLAGEPVGDDVLTKLMDALNAAGRRVTFSDIPRD